MTTQSSERESISHVPGYIAERNRHAGEAGLLTEKRTHKDGMLSTWYSGSEAQFRSARLLRMPAGFAFPAKLGGRRLFSLRVFSPASPQAELKCTIVKTGEDRYRLAVANELMPVAWRSLGTRIEVYKYCDLREGLNTGPATVYVGAFSALRAAGIAPAQAEHAAHSAPHGQHGHHWQSQPLGNGRHRFVVYHEAEARAHAQEEERGRSDFTNPDHYQDWLLEVVAASIAMIRRQLRVKTKRRLIYTVPARTLKDLEAHFARMRRTITRSEIIVEKEDVRDEERRAELRRAALAAMRDAEFQRFLGKAAAPLPRKR